MFIKTKIARPMLEALCGGGFVLGIYVVAGILFSESAKEFAVMCVVGLVYGLLAFVAYPAVDEVPNMLETDRMRSKRISRMTVIGIGTSTADTKRITRK